jgi:hypothetical protein
VHVHRAGPRSFRQMLDGWAGPGVERGGQPDHGVDMAERVGPERVEGGELCRPQIRIESLRALELSPGRNVHFNRDATCGSDSGPDGRRRPVVD